MKQQLNRYCIQNIIESIVQMVSDSLIETDIKKMYLKRLSKLNYRLLGAIYESAKEILTNKDMQYIICFVADIHGKDISLLFNVNLASVNSVRYRIRKKMSEPIF